MVNEVTPHFSRKILFLSLIFILANLGIYGLRLLTAQPEALKATAPKLVSATIGDILVKSPYDGDYGPATQDEEIYAGTSVKTGDKEFAELILDNNTIRLNEQTEIRITRNDYYANPVYLPDTPRLGIELISGSIWVNAFDLIDVMAPRSMTSLHHSVAMLTYTNPINRLMVVTGSADLSLLDADGKVLSDFVVPLNNQVTFVDSQITPTYAALKPSKLRKELKMAPLAPEVMADEWVSRNVNEMAQVKEEFAGTLIDSAWSYKLTSTYETILSYLTFSPDAQRNLTLEKAKTIVAYLLGGVQKSGNLAEAQTLIDQLDSLWATRSEDPAMDDLLVQTLYAIEYSSPKTPAYLLKDDFILKVAQKEGPGVYGIYLTDLRRAFYDNDTKSADVIADKWLASWKPRLKKDTIAEFERQGQILEHTILSYIGAVSPEVLNVFDESGMMDLAKAKDTEETRYEIITNRLQVAASLISSYRYALAKQYLKNSYLGLNIENLSPDLASTQVFTENGKLLAQRLEFADAVLHGAAQPIDETQFAQYFQTIRRDQALSADLRKFFQLDQGQTAVETKAEAPTAEQVASRFLDDRINVNFTDINLKEGPGFTYDIKNARLIDRGSDGSLLSFDATYDYMSNSVTDLIAFGNTYHGPFALEDAVTLMKQGGNLESRIPKPEVQQGVEMLITDQAKIQAQEGQAIAQDVARQLAYNQITQYGITIPDLKFNIDITDAVNLNQFAIKKALIDRPDQSTPVSISFDYSSASGEVTDVMSEEGVLLIGKTQIADLKAQVIAKTQEVEKELQAISAFEGFVSDNNLTIDPQNVIYTQNALISFKDLELTSLGLKVTGLFDPVTKLFVSVSHPLLSMQGIGVREYFKMLSDQFVIQYMSGKGFTVTADQIQSRYPFDEIAINKLNIGGYLFSFTLDMTANKALGVKRENSSVVIDELTLDELKVQPDLIRASEAAPGVPVPPTSSPALPSTK